MTRSEWVQRYVSAMRACGSDIPDDHLRDRAEAACDATEQAGWTDPATWEAPESIAQEHMEVAGRPNLAREIEGECPHCHASVAYADWAALIDEPDLMACPICRQASQVDSVFPLAD